MSKTLSWFVTGTDTGIGKTLVAGALLHALAQKGMRAAGMKPIAAGAELRDGVWRNEDCDFLAAASNVALPAELATPYLLREAAAPSIAAKMEGVSIDLAHIIASYKRIADMADAVVVEGVGGFYVPLSAQHDTADLAQDLALPVIMVVGLRLGCLSHALMTAEAIAARGLTLAGWVANVVDPDMSHVLANLRTLSKRLGAPLLGYLPRLPQATAEMAASSLDFSGLAGWPVAPSDLL